MKCAYLTLLDSRGYTFKFKVCASKEDMDNMVLVLRSSPDIEAVVCKFVED